MPITHVQTRGFLWWLRRSMLDAVGRGRILVRRTPAGAWTYVCPRCAMHGAACEDQAQALQLARFHAGVWHA